MRLKNFHSGSFLTLQPTFATDPILAADNLIDGTLPQKISPARELVGLGV